MRTETSKLLLEYFFTWQKTYGERKTVKEFAEFIGLSDKVLNHVFTGNREPTLEQSQLFAVVFNDRRFLEVTDRPPGDIDLIYIQRHWSKLDQSIKDKIAGEVSRYTTEPLPECDKEN